MNQNAPLVSIIIPTYNVEVYIAECLESALAQTYPEIEIIIVDNNSSDNTLAIINDYKLRHPKLIRVFSEKIQGASFARNRGLKYAEGKWIQFLDADDLLLNDKIEKQMSIAERTTAFINGSWYYLSANHKVAHLVSANEGLVRCVFKGTGCGNMCSNLWNSNDIKLVGGFDTTTDTDDQDLMLRIFLVNQNIRNSDLPLTLIRDRPDGSNLSRQNITKHYLAHIVLRKNFIAKLKSDNPKYYFEQRQYLWHCVYWYCRLLSSHNLKCGINAYYSVMPKDFQPTFILRIDNPKWHIFLTKWIGFGATEKLKFGFRKIFPKRIT